MGVVIRRYTGTIVSSTSALGSGIIVAVFGTKFATFMVLQAITT